MILRVLLSADTLGPFVLQRDGQEQLLRCL